MAGGLWEWPLRIKRAVAERRVRREKWDEPGLWLLRAVCVAQAGDWLILNVGSQGDFLSQHAALSAFLLTTLML